MSNDHNPSIYFKLLKGNSSKNIVLIPGAYHTGQCYLETPNKRDGWAKMFNKDGYNVYITDLPGTGQSKSSPFESISGQSIVDAYVSLINTIPGEVDLLTHSLSGPFGFKIAEKMPEKIKKVISIEPGLIGNVQEPTIPISEADDSINIKFKDFDFNIDMTKYLLPTNQLIDRFTKTSRFPNDSESLNRYISLLVGVHPRLMYERFNINNSQLRIDNFENLLKTKFLIITGEDLVHIDEDSKITEEFNKHNLSVKHIFLKNQGITGNGHMMMLENNNEDIYQLIHSWLNKTV